MGEKVGELSFNEHLQKMLEKLEKSLFFIPPTFSPFRMIKNVHVYLVIYKLYYSVKEPKFIV